MKKAALTFTPYAWAKYLHLRDVEDDEMAAFGISSNEEPLLITDLVMVEQEVTGATVEMNDDAVADHFDKMVQKGLQPKNFARVWLHTHPGNSAQPSPTDETTFAGVFSECYWSVMCILAQGGNSYARLSTSIDGIYNQSTIDIAIDWSKDCPAIEHAPWDLEYTKNVKKRWNPVKKYTPATETHTSAGTPLSEYQQAMLDLDLLDSEPGDFVNPVIIPDAWDLEMEQAIANVNNWEELTDKQRDYLYATSTTFPGV